MKNHYLFLIWNTAYPNVNLIRKYLKKRFIITHEAEIYWDEYLFEKNLSRFYFDSPTISQVKKIETGCGPFKVLLIKDENPKFGKVVIRGLIEKVNLNIFDSKQYLRDLTGGGHKIHASNSLDESRANSLMLGINNKNKILFSNPPGSVSWNSLREALDFLNNFMPYIVLRGVDDIKHNNNPNDDIDLLVEDAKKAALIINSVKSSKLTYRRNYIIKVKNRIVKLDIRDQNDNYYDYRWSKNMLKQRVKNKSGIYINSNKNQFYSLAYHVLIHKYSIPQKYKKFIQKNGSLNKIKKELITFLYENNYKFVEPEDFTVGFNHKDISLKRRTYLLIKPLKFMLRLVPKKLLKLYAYIKKNSN